MKVQYLTESFVSSKDKKRTQDTEVTFSTTEVDCNTLMHGKKTALIVWVDKDEFNAAINE